MLGHTSQMLTAAHVRPCLSSFQSLGLADWAGKTFDVHINQGRDYYLL